MGWHGGGEARTTEDAGCVLGSTRVRRVGVPLALG